MARQALQAHQSDTLAQENEALRKLLGLRERLVPSLAAQILYETADPYTRRVMLDGAGCWCAAGLSRAGWRGVLGQVTRVFPLVSEVTLVTDRTRRFRAQCAHGCAGVAYGDPVASHGGGMELRFVSANADVQDGDVLATNGLDGALSCRPARGPCGACGTPGGLGVCAHLL
jgi:rod shape-determining protein MreC